MPFSPLQQHAKGFRQKLVRLFTWRFDTLKKPLKGRGKRQTRRAHRRRKRSERNSGCFQEVCLMDRQEIAVDGRANDHAYVPAG